MAMAHNATPVTVRGRRFPSLTAAARHFSISVAAVSTAVQAGRADRIGAGTTRRQKIEINGAEFRSLHEAARQLGIPYSTLRDRLAREAKVKADE